MQVNDKKHNALGVIIALAIIAGCIFGIVRGVKNHKEDTPEVPKYSAVQLLREQHKDELTPWELTIMAIFWTESKCNPCAVGKDHDTGVLQLTPIYIREANRIAGADYELADAFDIEKSVEIFSIMQDHYNPEHDVEKAIRLHNRSPYYRREVLKNLEFIKKMEAVREAVKK